MSAKKMAEALGMDMTGFKEYEYQPHCWSHRIWAVGQRYYTLTKGKGAKPPKVTGKFAVDEWQGEWRKMDPSELHIAPEGYTVWECVARSE